MDENSADNVLENGEAALAGGNETIELELNEEEEASESSKTVEKAEALTETQAFSRRLNEKQKENLEKIEQLRCERDEAQKLANQYREATAKFGYKGDDQTVIDALTASSMGKPLEQYRNERQAEQVRLEQAVANHPVFKQAQRINSEAQFSRDLAAIKAAYPQEKAGHALELGEKFIDLMATGKVDAVTAYEIAHKDTILTQKSAVARQAAINSVSKDHLRPSQGSGGTRVEVPKDTYTLYKKLNPKMTEAQIARHYANSRKD